jgi:hypothetical protein
MIITIPRPSVDEVRGEFNKEGLIEALKKKIPEGQGIGVKDMADLLETNYGIAVTRTCEFYEKKIREEFDKANSHRPGVIEIAN